MEIIVVNSKKEWDQFLQLPFSIHKNDPCWVPPLLMEQRRILNRKKNPFFNHCIYKAWLIRNDGIPVGRILAYIDHVYNHLHNEKVGFLGFFECIDDQITAQALFAAVINWLKQESMDKVYGPINFSIGNECGVLLNGFDHSPALQMNHTPPYYPSLFDKANFEKEHDLYAYLMTEKMVLDKQNLLPRLRRITEKTLRIEGIKFRTIDMKNYKSELENINSLYNKVMHNNWGFVPSTEQEIFYTGASLKMIVDPQMIFFAEINNKVVGCSLSIPDFNEVLKHMNGRLFPFGIFKILWYKRKVRSFRLMLLGVHEEYRKKGLDILFYYYTITRGLELGYNKSELSWISEDNSNLIAIVEKIGAIRYKTYRMYRKNI